MNIPKFRVWCPKRKQMYPFFGVEPNGLRDILMEVSEGTLYDVISYPDGKLSPRIESNDNTDTYILMQWAGLVDSEGREIYESDIIQSGEIKLSVIWHKGALGCNFDYETSQMLDSKIGFHALSDAHTFLVKNTIKDVSHGKLVNWKVVANIYEQGFSMTGRLLTTRLEKHHAFN